MSADGPDFGDFEGMGGDDTPTPAPERKLFGQAAPGYMDTHGRISKIRYTHDAMIDIIMSNPAVSQGELAQAFGYSQAWISKVIGSDAFQARLAARRKELVDPILVMSIEERFRGLIIQSTEVIANKLEATQDAKLAIQTLELSSKALGFGARDRGPTVNNAFVVQLPQKAEDSQSWLSRISEKRLAGPDTSGPIDING